MEISSLLGIAESEVASALAAGKVVVRAPNGDSTVLRTTQQLSAFASRFRQGDHHQQQQGQSAAAGADGVARPPDASGAAGGGSSPRQLFMA